MPDRDPTVTVVFKVDEDKIFQRDFTLSTDRKFICAHVLSGCGVARWVWRG
jgi:hypothetical protein